jgi:uncharacterized membrane protein
MTWFIVGLVVFLGLHSVAIVAPAWRDATAARLGERAWKGLYSVISIASFVLLIWGYGLARMDPVVLYTPPAWTRWLTALLMLPAFPLLLAAYFPGRIKAALKHPMLAAVKFWALAHLVSNGTLPDLLLFGAFLAWAVADRISFKRRVQRPIHTAPATGWNDAIAVIAGLTLYFVFMNWLHVRWIGVSPMPLAGG